MLINNPVIALGATGWKFAGRFRPAIVFYLILFLLSQCMSLAEPWVIGKIINCVQQAAGTGFHDWRQLFNEIELYLILFFATQVGFWAFHGPGRLIERYVAFHIKAAYKGHMFALVTQMPLQWHRVHHSGDSIDKINRASNSLCEFFDNLFEVSYMLFRLTGAVIILSWFMPFAGATALLVTATSFFVVFGFDRILYTNYQDLNNLENKVASAVHDYVTNIISIITLRLGGRVNKEVERRMFSPLVLFHRTNVLNEWKWCLTTILIAVMIVVVLSWYTHDALSTGKGLMAGTFFTLFEYLRRIGDSFYNFAYIYGATVRQAADVQSARPLFEDRNAVESSEAESSLPAGWKTIAVKHVNFVYEDEKHREHHLVDVSLQLERGKAIALVGESGSGKSTLLNLLRGMQFAPSAELVCDGARLPGGLQQLAGTTTLMPQDPEIFADTIRFNVTFGMEADEEEMTAAIKMARFDPVLARLPDGLDTNIAEKGVNLSGGEKQRLALARGLFFARESEIVLLDEPTSSVDAQNERAIYAAILRKFTDKCVISSIHKLHLLEMFDYIYVFDDGRLVEEGTFENLLSTGGRLAQLWQSCDLSGQGLSTAEEDAGSADRTSSEYPVLGLVEFR